MRWHLIENSSGSAVITVIAVVGVGLIMALAYIFGMYLEERSARMFLESVRASYVAESLANYGRVLIEKDDSYGVDGVNDLFIEVFKGSDVDLDGDGTPESRWISLTDDLRGAVFVEDETGKANLNCPKLNCGLLFDYLVDKGMLSSDFSDVWEKILGYLMGEDLQWGVAGKDDNYNNFILECDGIDNDLDGQVDEVGEGVDDWTEYVPWQPYGDDRTIVSVEGIESILGREINKEEFEVLSKYFTTSAISSGLDTEGLPKLNPNYISVEELSQVLLSCGIKDAWRKAVNIRDFLDKDFARSVIYPRGYTFFLSLTETAPSWKSVDGQMVFSGQTDKWEYWKWEGVSEGSYYVYFYSKEEENYIGDVRVNGVEQDEIYSGEGFLGKTVYVGSDGILKLEIRVPSDRVQDDPAIQFIELVPVEMKGKLDKRICGIEGIRIRSVFCNPVEQIPVTSASLIRQGDWMRQGDLYVNAQSNGASGEGIWEFSGIKDGFYYVKFLSQQEGSPVGDVWISGIVNYKVTGGDWFSESVQVVDGKLRVRIQNNQPDGTVCSFGGIILSQQPDVEFVEICNLINREVDIGGWSLVMPGNPCSPAYIPMGTTIGAKSCMILTVDADDTCAGISNNRISFKDVFPEHNGVVVQLDLATDIRKGMDVFKGQDKIYLKDSYGLDVDAVEVIDAPSFVQLLREDLLSSDYLIGESEFSSWKQVAFDDIEFDCPQLKEIYFANCRVVNVGEMFSISNGVRSTLSKEDLSKMFGKFSLDEILLEPVGYVVSGWKQVNDYFVSENKGQVLELKWDNHFGIFRGMYRIVIELGSNDAVRIYIYRDGKWEDFGKLWADESGYVDLGWVELESELRMKIVSEEDNVSFYAAHLFPKYHCYCKININTASEESLLSLGLDLDTIKRVIENRPYGDDFMGIGKVINILGEEEIGSYFNSLAINSDSFTVISLGQVLKANKVRGERKIWVSVKRQ